MRLSFICPSLILIAALLYGPAHASAYTLQLESTGSSYVWIGNYLGVATVVVENNSTRTCKGYFIGQGGLFENTVIKGTGYGENFYFFPPTGASCVPPLSPLVTNGHQLEIQGGGGTDGIDGRSYTSTVRGDAGNDLISSTYGYLYGGDGDDRIEGAWSTFQYGEYGNDRLCALPGTFASRLDGGPGVDAYCGTAITYVSAVPASRCDSLNGC